MSELRAVAILLILYIAMLLIVLGPVAADVWRLLSHLL